ncbi:hypothetical protein [Paraburkholderia caribensis]|uniref:hypothetical protein n=1 Tax=Paraburkholderia caribensis TaxID=75105 RepID=UPI002860A53A|nr:hypothetical protein [Paraburkholderia caribensis]MDR6384255.1 hypothetical protein [Paraburkholderia caribensis]
MKKQKGEPTAEQANNLLTVEQKYKKLSIVSMERMVQAAARFRAIGVLIEALLRQPPITLDDRTRAQVSLALALENLEYFESDTLNLMDLAKIVCLDAGGFVLPTNDIGETLRLMGDLRSPRKKRGDVDYASWGEQADSSGAKTSTTVKSKMSKIGGRLRTGSRAKRTGRALVAQ